MVTVLFRFFFQSQSQGSITLKIIPAVADEDKLKENPVRLSCLQNSFDEMTSNFKQLFLIIFSWKRMFDGFAVMELQPLRRYDYKHLNRFSHLYAKLGQWVLHFIARCEFNVFKWTFLQKVSLSYLFVLSKGIPSGFVQLHTLRGQSHALPGGGTSF